MRLAVCLATIAGVVLSSLLLCGALAQPKKSGGGDAAGEFQKLLKQWTAVVKELREIQLEFRVAKEEQREELARSFQAKMAEAKKMMPQVAAAGEAAYKADPRDEQLRDFILQMAGAARHLRGDFQDTLRLSELLTANIDTLPEDVRPMVYTWAGASAMEYGDLELARKHLKAAGDAPGAKTYRDLLDEEEKIWSEEQKQRAAEAKAGNLPRVRIETNRGPIVVELFENEAPNTVANFIHLVKNKMYDGTVFHRVIPGFVIQGGDPKGDGTGGPGWQIACECYGEKFRRHFRGSLSMAHSGKDTGGSQFFICLNRYPVLPKPPDVSEQEWQRKGTRHLDRTLTEDGKPKSGHTVFGRVVEGMDVLSQIQRREPQSQQGVSITPDRIISATVVGDLRREYVPKKIGEEKKKEEKEKKADTKEKGKEKDAKAKDAKAKDEKAKQKA